MGLGGVEQGGVGWSRVGYGGAGWDRVEQGVVGCSRVEQGVAGLWRVEQGRAEGSRLKQGGVGLRWSEELSPLVTWSASLTPALYMFSATVSTRFSDPRLLRILSSSGDYSLRSVLLFPSFTGSAGDISLPQPPPSRQNNLARVCVNCSSSVRDE